MVAKSQEIYDISDAELVTAGSSMFDLQVAASEGLGSFLDEVGSGLSSRYLIGLVHRRWAFEYELNIFIRSYTGWNGEEWNKIEDMNFNLKSKSTQSHLAKIAKEISLNINI